MTDRHAILTPDAPQPAPVYSQGVRQAGLVQVSGQGPQDPVTGEYVHQGDIRAQTTRTLTNVLGILRAGGLGMDDVIMVRVYITKQSDFAAMNEAYGAFMAAHCATGILPARTTLVVGLPRPEMLVEIDALAVG